MFVYTNRKNRRCQYCGRKTNTIKTTFHANRSIGSQKFGLHEKKDTRWLCERCREIALRHHTKKILKERLVYGEMSRMQLGRLEGE